MCYGPVTLVTMIHSYSQKARSPLHIGNSWHACNELNGQHVDGSIWYIHCSFLALIAAVVVDTRAMLCSTHPPETPVDWIQRDLPSIILLQALRHAVQ